MRHIQKKDIKNFDRHLNNFFSLAILVFLMVTGQSAMLLIASIKGVSLDDIPMHVHFLNLFVGVMMTIMVVAYRRILLKK